MIGARARQDLPLLGPQPGTIPQDQGPQQGLPGGIRQDLSDTLTQPLAPAIDNIDPGPGVQAPVLARAADVSRGLDTLLEQPALVIEPAGIGKAVGWFEASGQAPALTGPQHRCILVPAQAHQPLEADGPSVRTRVLDLEQKPCAAVACLTRQAGDPAGQPEIPAHQGLRKGRAQNLADLDPGPQKTDQDRGERPQQGSAPSYYRQRRGGQERKP